jgi:protein-S-isoprenylcysteine O-methyltransferase Ste14
VAAGIFLLACLIWIIPEMRGTLKQRASTTRKEALISDHGSMIILIGLQWIGLALNFLLAGLLPGAAIIWQQTLIFCLGIILILLGVSFRWYAIRTLGRNFTRDVAVSAHQQVTQDGPYRLIRHPAYSGTLLTMAGVGLAMTNWASLIALLICVLAGHMYRVHIEEKALMQTIGQPYTTYMQCTKRFIPWVF